MIGCPRIVGSIGVAANVADNSGSPDSGCSFCVVTAIVGAGFLRGKAVSLVSGSVDDFPAFLFVLFAARRSFSELSAFDAGFREAAHFLPLSVV